MSIKSESIKMKKQELADFLCGKKIKSIVFSETITEGFNLEFDDDSVFELDALLDNKGEPIIGYIMTKKDKS